MTLPEMLFDKTLLIEDDIAHALLIRRALARFCAQVEHVKSLEEGVKALRGEAIYSLVVTDLNLPDSRSPATTVDTVRRTSRTVPILVLTSSQSLKDAVEAMRSGANDFVVKQFDQDFSELIGLSLSKLFSQIEVGLERQRLEREMMALRLAIENSSDGLAVASRDGTIRYQNSAFRHHTLGWRNATGRETPRSLQELFSARVKGGDELVVHVSKALAELSAGGVWRVGIELVDDPTVAFDFSISASSPDGEAVAWVRNISELRRREKLQRELLSTTTHDLKGPLHAILLSTELIKTRGPDEKLIDLVIPRIASSAHGAINLIDEFLSARQIEEGALILVPTMTDVKALVEDTLAEFSPSFLSKALTVVPRMQEVGQWLVDGTALRRVLSNLLSNAIKFTPKGGQIDVSVESNDDRMSITVKDSGVGIDPSEANKIFDRYRRLHQGEFSGSGLGLFIVRSIVSAHGGSLEVTSRLGEGCAITSLWPRNPPVNTAGELISFDLTAE